MGPFASEQDRSSYARRRAGTLAPKIACAQPANGKDRKIMKRDLGGLYAVGVFRLNKVGGFILGGHGDKKQFDVEY